MIEQRKCKNGCGEWKELFLFPKDATCSGGHAYKCRECRNKERRLLREDRVRPDYTPPADLPAIRDAWQSTRIPTDVRPQVFGAVVRHPPLQASA